MNEAFGSPKTPAAQEILNLLFTDPNRGWGPFWSAYGEVVKNRLWRFRFRPDDCADVLQEVTLRLVKNNFQILRKWDSSRGKLEAYLSVISASVCLDFIRKTKEFLEEGEELVDPKPGPSGPYRVKELEGILFQVLERWSQEGLSESDRELIEGRFKEREYSEIAEDLGITVANAMTRFSRLKESLRKRLENAGIVGEDLEWGD